MQSELGDPGYALESTRFFTEVYLLMHHPCLDLLVQFFMSFIMLCSDSFLEPWSWTKDDDGSF